MIDWYQVTDLFLSMVIIGFEVAYWLRDKRKEKDDDAAQSEQLVILHRISTVLTEQKEVLEDSHAELADMRDEIVEEQNELNTDRHDS